MSARTEESHDPKSLLPRLEKVFGSVFKTTELREDTSIETVDLWDSMGHIELMVAIEKEFKIRIAPEDIVTLTKVTDICKYLEART